MRLLPKDKRDAIVKNIRMKVPKMSDFYFTESQIEVITGKQEGTSVTSSQSSYCGYFYEIVKLVLFFVFFPEKSILWRELIT